MKVLHVTGDYTLGGTETLLIALAENRLSCPAMEPEFLMFRDGILREQLRHAGTRVTCIGDVQLKRPTSVLRARAAFRRLLADREYDAVIFHQYAWMPLILDDIAQAAGITTLRWFHNEITKNGRTELALRTLRPKFPAVSICCSQFTKEIVSPAGASEVLYYPVSPRTAELGDEERRKTRYSLGAQDDDVVMIQVSRIAPRKGQAQHIQALGLLRDEPNWKCWIVGGVDSEEQRAYMQSLQTLAADLGITDRVKFLGKRVDVPRLLAAADIFCQPNIAPPEPFGISFIEAMYVGLPVVTSSMGGALEIVTPETGKLLPPADIQQLAQALRELCGDAPLRNTFRTYGPQRARELCEPAAQITKLRDLVLSSQTA